MALVTAPQFIVALSNNTLLADKDPGTLTVNTFTTTPLEIAEQPDALVTVNV